MARINQNYTKLPGSYLFSEIAKRVNRYVEQNPDKKVIKLGIGDVTQPLPEKVIKALHEAVDHMADGTTFKGYGPEQGYPFLIEKVIEYDYQEKGISIDPDEVFISDGSKCDVGNIQEIFGLDNVVAVTDPVYPVYVDTNVMAGRTGTLGEDGRWTKIQYLSCTAENGFVPDLPKQKADLIYLCLPNNPTGTTLNRSQLKQWVDYAKDNQSVIIFDAAYEAYITEDDVPHSIYEIEGAKETAIEMRSFSKNAGFTGTRCAYTVVPKQLKAFDEKNNPVSVNALWNRRQSTKFNGSPYIIQKGATAVYTKEGQQQVQALIQSYMKNASIIRNGLQEAGFSVYGGINAPYIWLKTPDHMDSWQFFDTLLETVHVVGTPGSGFGPCGEGYFRLTAFGGLENTKEAMDRIITHKDSLQ